MEKVKRSGRTRWCRQLLIALLASLGVLVPAPAVRAATTFTVTSNLDEPDAAPGDGVCRSLSGGVHVARGNHGGQC